MTTSTARKSARRKASADDYATGAVKQDPVTKAVAVRTAPPLMLPWAVMTVNNGGHFAEHADVESWIDWADTPVPDPDAAD